ncbi:acyl-CoA synthetase 7-like [Chironomus tepperi]|uniref:acyl-CoA synthetase 7-like n=1 Tax=Chironomus tepperi TaxID=113505 RepID=UPI00391FB8F5
MNSKFCTYDPVTKIWSGRKRQQIYNSDANAGYLFLQKLIQTPKNICQISDDTGVELTCADVYERSLKFANFFTQMNLKQGDVVGLIASNSENFWMPCDWSCCKSVVDCHGDGKIVGTVKIAVDKMESDAKIFTMIDKVEGFGYVDEILDGDFDVDSYKFQDLPNMSTTIATINCSSGTTSSPKGICKSHKQLISDSFLISNRKLHECDILFNSSQSYWASHLIFSIYGVLYNIPIVITSQPLTPELWIDIVDRYKVTLVMVAPMVCYGILNSRKLKKLESTRIVLVGGSVFTTKLITDFAQIIPNGKVITVYGSTEADSISMAYKYEDGLIRSSGYPYYNTDIKIVNEDGTALGPNEVGEIYCKKSYPFLGYFGDIQITAESIDSSGFFKTGDAGYFDECGRIYIVDRIKHMIKSINCYKVTPIEIESIINEIDGVILSCVVGVIDEEVFYDKIYAFVIKDQARDDLTEEFIVNFVNGKVIEEKKISGGVHFVDRFPMTPTGKVLNRELKKIAATLSKC